MRCSIILSILGASELALAGCPFHQLRDTGLLSERELELFQAVKRDPKAAETLFQDFQSRQPEADIEEEKREAAPEPQLLGGIIGGILDLGGGLLGGVLQPLSGILEGLDIPTPQKMGLEVIPGNDPDHQFEYPGDTDVRGLCPTLNTLANHGYIDRSGITTFAEASNACQIGYGFSYGLCTVLSALGLIAGGDLVTGKYSIGGADDRVPNTLGPALGLDKHGTFEIDNSITRPDQYFDNQANFDLSRWDRLVGIADKYDGDFGLQTFIEEKDITYEESKATNPEFFAGAKWFVVAHAERVFVYRALPNGTTPDVADFANIAPFFLNETFPPHWFRRETAYTIPNLLTDILSIYLPSPKPLGANEGLNNFIPLGADLSSMTADQLGCFILQNIFDIIPGQLQPALADSLDIYKAFANGMIAPFFSDFSCNLDDYTSPSLSAGETTDPSESNAGPIIINGVYQ